MSAPTTHDLFGSILEIDFKRPIILSCTRRSRYLSVLLLQDLGPEKWMHPCHCSKTGFCKFGSASDALERQGVLAKGRRVQVWPSSICCKCGHTHMHKHVGILEVMRAKPINGPCSCYLAACTPTRKLSVAACRKFWWPRSTRQWAWIQTSTTWHGRLASVNKLGLSKQRLNASVILDLPCDDGQD